jgi:hypothetical protein
MRLQHKPLDRGVVLWQPDWDRLMAANARLHDGFVAVSDEWQAFVTRRVEADLRLWQELVVSKTPVALWSAYRKFWQGAFEDYRNEYLALNQVYAKAVSSGTTAAQQTSQRAFLHAKAA